MKIKTSFSRKVFCVFNYTLLGLFAFACVLPIWHVFMASFSDPYFVMSTKGIIPWIKDFTLDGYRLVFQNKSIWTGYANTIFYVFTATALGMVITLMGAYVMSRPDFLWKNPIMFLLSISMLFNGGIIPTFMVVKNLGMYNSRLALIIPGCFSIFNMIMMRTSFQSMPEALVESARLDGAGHMTILFRIMLPLNKATAAVLILYYAVGHWNNWFSAAIYLRDRALYPLQLILQEILVKNSSVSTVTSAIDLAYETDMYRELVQYCSIVVAIVPILVFYPFIQKHFKKGVMIGSIKG